MLHLFFSILVGITIVICCVLGILLLFLSVPHDHHIQNYRIIRRVLAIAYLVMAGANIAGFLAGDGEANPFIIHYLTLIISSSQSFLFTYALITLFNTEFFTPQKVIKELIPIGILTIGCFTGLFIQLPESVKYSIFYVGTAYYVFQLINYTLLFNRQFREYQEKLDRYFSEKLALQLSWSRFSFYLALSVGIIALLSVFVTSVIASIFFVSVYAFFYLFFGIKYLNYTYLFHTIEPITHQVPEIKTETVRLNNNDMAKAVEQWMAQKKFLDPGITLIDLAAQLNTNRTYLSNYINQQHGMNFNAWINWLRVQESQTLLVELPQLTIAEISERLGYSDQGNFSRSFQKYMGTTPSSWKRDHIASKSSSYAEH
ncbi:MAG TPA: helix-turn-helix domain-containing protein [Prolixibacteraceae bacterium]|nr:helix-turn-helix domain-containing protein [Prolixibacteraceae bacterium]